MIYFTSDFHFHHNKDFIYKSRGYPSVEEMNQDLINKYNSLVTDEDTVYILGDLCLGGAQKDTENFNLLSLLNGKIHIIRGNHDTDNRLNMYRRLPKVQTIDNASYLKFQGYHFYLSHYPTMTANFDLDRPLKQKLINICGHTHTNYALADLGPNIIYHVEVDAHNNYPVAITDIIEQLEQAHQSFL